MFVECARGCVMPTQVGPGVTGLSEGDVVLPTTPLLGTFTQAAVVKAKQVVGVGRLASLEGSITTPAEAGQQSSKCLCVATAQTVCFVGSSCHASRLGGLSVVVCGCHPLLVREVENNGTKGVQDELVGTHVRVCVWLHAGPESATVADELSLPLEYLAVHKELVLAYRLLEAHSLKVGGGDGGCWWAEVDSLFINTPRVSIAPSSTASACMA